MNASGIVVRAEAVGKRYGEGAAARLALQSVSVAIAAGEFVALMGPSGCGKTTLLNLLGAMDLPSTGRIWLDGHDTSRLDDDALTRLRRRCVGFVFQAFHLIPTLNVRENIALPLLLGAPASDREARVQALAAAVGLSARLDAFPHEISGGEAQRVALARALIRQPPLLIADEPTGNLDSQSSTQVLNLLAKLAAEHGAAVVMATHSAEAAAWAQRVVRLRDGALDCRHEPNAL
ncbi:MAG TPA: ABC transporter ATP-binding protein [Terriglobales bacterium]|nr:ABC transporter ATP-binding protein [Terriglobales bacterium]